MIRRVLPSLLIAALAGGCVPDGQGTLLVPDNPFGAPPPVPPTVRTAFAPASTEVAARVDTIGRNLVASNPQTGVRPLFRTIGAPQPEIFHRGTSEIYISEGLAKQCTTDAQLTAVLSSELGKLVSEREALAGPRAWQADQQPPPSVPVGNNDGSYFGAADMVRQAELAKFKPPAHREPPPPPPDPEQLARIYLQRCGIPASELDAVAPLLQSATVNSTLEKQLVAPPPARPFTN